MKKKHAQLTTWRMWILSDLSERTRCQILVEGKMGTDEVDSLIELLGISRRVYEKAELEVKP